MPEKKPEGKYIDAFIYKVQHQSDYLRVMSRYMNIAQICERYSVKRSTAYNIIASIDQTKVLRVVLSPDLAAKLDIKRPFLVADRETVRDHMRDRKRPGNWMFRDSSYQSRFRAMHH